MTEKQKLISRIVDREDRPRDWATLEDVAKQDRNAWRDLLFALRDDAEVRQAVEARLAAADGIAPPAVSATGGKGNGWSRAAVMAVAGWVAAAAMALLWLGPVLSGNGSPAAPAGAPKAAPEAAPGAAPGAGPGNGVLAGLANAGAPHPGDPTNTLAHIVGELPRLMVQARPVAGREEVEVLYVRRTLERMLVRKAYQLKLDESGQPFTVPADLTAYMPPRVY